MLVSRQQQQQHIGALNDEAGGAETCSSCPVANPSVAMPTAAAGASAIYRYQRSD